MKKLHSFFICMIMFWLVAVGHTCIAQTTTDTAQKRSNASDSMLADKNKSDSLLDSSAAQATSMLKVLESKKQLTQDEISELRRQLKKVQEQIKEGKRTLINLDTNIKKDQSKLGELQIAATAAKDAAEKADSTLQKANDRADSVKEATANMAASYSALQVAVNEKMDSLEIAGVLEMRKTVRIRRDTFVHAKNAAGRDTVVLEQRTSRRDAPLHIEKIFVNVKEGVMQEVNVTTNRGMYRNVKEPLDLLHFDRRGGDRLYYVNKDYRRDKDSIFLFLDDVLTYTPVGSFHDVPYTDFRVTLEDTPKKRFYQIQESTSLNSYFNIAAYTDLKGIGGEPNGIVQFNASGKFITRTKNIKGTAIVPFHFVSFQGNLAKFDNDFRGSTIYHEDSVSRRDVFQRTIYSVGLRANLLRGFESPVPKHMLSDWQLNIGTTFAGAKLHDTLYKDVAGTVIDTVYKNIISLNTFIEPAITFTRRQNFSMTVSCPVYFNLILPAARIANDHLEIWPVPGLALMYYGKRETGSKVFFRYNYYFNVRQPEEAFSQIQLGYSVNLSDLLNNKKKE